MVITMLIGAIAAGYRRSSARESTPTHRPSVTNRQPVRWAPKARLQQISDGTLAHANPLSARDPHRVPATRAMSRSKARAALRAVLEYH